MRKEKTIKNIMFTLLSQVIYIICGFLVPKILIKGYGSEMYALTTSISQFLAYITLLESGLGLVVKSVLYKPIAEKNEKEINSILYSAQKFFNKIALLFLVYVVILCIFYPMTKSAEIFDFSLTASLIVIIALSTFFEYFFGMIYKLFLQADQKTYVISMVQVVTYIMNVTFILVLVHFKFDIRIVKLVSSLIFILRPVIQILYVRKNYNINLKNANKNYIIPSKKDGLAQHIAGIINTNTDVTLLTIFTDMISVAIYSVYGMIASSVMTVINSFTTGSDAMFGDLYARDEREKLKHAFDTYESMYIVIVTIIFSCTNILIVPFVSVYTSGINDANYIQPLFAFLLVTAYFFQAIKSPYNSLAHDAGKFKETKVGSWIEAIINIVVSLILVKKYGMVGVVIGTLASVIYRGISFIKYVSSDILDRNILISLKKLFLCLVQYLLIYIICKFIKVNVHSYLSWILYAMMVFGLSSAIVMLTTVLFDKKLIKNIRELLVRKRK